MRYPASLILMRLRTESEVNVAFVEVVPSLIELVMRCHISGEAWPERAAVTQDAGGEMGQIAFRAVGRQAGS